MMMRLRLVHLKSSARHRKSTAHLWYSCGVKMFAFALIVFATVLEFVSGQFYQTTAFSAAGCSAASASPESYLHQVNTCGSFNGTAPFNKYTAVTTGTKTTISGYKYTTSTCTGTGVLEFGNLTVGGFCNRLAPNLYFTILPVTTVVPSASSYVQSFYTSQAGCVASSAASLFGAIINPQSVVIGGNQVCGDPIFANVACPGSITSVTGGFMVKRFFTDAACTSASTLSEFHQIGVCNPSSATVGSQILTSFTKPTGQTLFNITNFWGSTACSMVPTAPSTSVIKASAVVLNTTACVRSVTSSDVSNGPFYSVALTTTMGSVSGAGLNAYATAAGCNAATPSSVLTGIYYNDVCTQINPSNQLWRFRTLSACPAVVNTPVTLYATTRLTSATLTLAVAQSPTFKATFAKAVSSTLGVASTAVTITGVSATTRRQLLQTAIAVTYTVATTVSAQSAVTTMLTTSGPSVTSVLSNTYPGTSAANPAGGVSASPPTVAPSVAPTVVPSQAAKSVGVATASPRVETVVLSLLVCLGIMCAVN